MKISEIRRFQPVPDLSSVNLQLFRTSVGSVVAIYANRVDRNFGFIEPDTMCQLFDFHVIEGVIKEGAEVFIYYDPQEESFLIVRRLKDGFEFEIVEREIVEKLIGEKYIYTPYFRGGD
jgi:hypothetical protein